MVIPRRKQTLCSFSYRHLAIVLRPLFCSLLFVVVASSAGCRLFSSDDEEIAPFFRVEVGETELAGTGIGRLSDGELEVWGQFVAADSTFRFVQFTLAEFDGEGIYPLDSGTGSGFNYGTYGAIGNNGITVRYGFASGRSEDMVEIDAYDAAAGVVRGEIFFFSEAQRAFDGFEASDIFSVSGQFLAELK